MPQSSTSLPLPVVFFQLLRSVADLGFFRTINSLGLVLSSLTEGQMADALVTISLGKSTDCTAGSQITIKAVRWIATHAGVQALRVSWSPLVESFLKSRIPKELKESLPFSLFAMVQLERRILMSSCSTYEVVLIGAILVCTWAGLRFADAQRCSYRTMCFDGKSLRGTCWRTKTSSWGQPWGIISSGMLSLGSFSWVEKWLVTMDQLWICRHRTFFFHRSGTMEWRCLGPPCHMQRLWCGSES